VLSVTVLHLKITRLIPVKKKNWNWS